MDAWMCCCHDDGRYNIQVTFKDFKYTSPIGLVAIYTIVLLKILEHAKHITMSVVQRKRFFKIF